MHALTAGALQDALVSHPLIAELHLAEERFRQMADEEVFIMRRDAASSNDRWCAFTQNRMSLEEGHDASGNHRATGSCIC